MLSLRTFNKPFEHSLPRHRCLNHLCSVTQVRCRPCSAHAAVDGLCSTYRVTLDSAHDREATSRPLARSSTPFHRRPDTWRTPDQGPICISCGIVGRVANHCCKDPSPFDTMGKPAVSLSRALPMYTTDDQRLYTNRRPPSPRERSLSPMHASLTDCGRGKLIAAVQGARAAS